MKPFILSTQAIVVFGGLSGWGKKIAGICRGASCAVVIVDRTTTDADARKAIAHADTVFLAAPDNEIRKILQKHAHCFVGKNLLDCATNKSDFADLLQEIALNCDVCSTHPMVRSETPSRGHNVLLMPINDTSTTSRTIAREIFGLLEMNIRDVDFRKHGEIMSILQFMPHMIQRVLIASLGKILRDNNLNINDIGQCTSANFLFIELAIGRASVQRPSVSSGIISEALKTDFGRHVFQVLQDNLAALKEVTDRSVLEQRFNDEVHALGVSNAWRTDMDEITDAIIEEMQHLKASPFARRRRGNSVH